MTPFWPLQPNLKSIVSWYDEMKSSRIRLSSADKTRFFGKDFAVVRYSNWVNINSDQNVTEKIAGDHPNRRESPTALTPDSSDTDVSFSNRFPHTRRAKNPPKKGIPLVISCERNLVTN